MDATMMSQSMPPFYFYSNTEAKPQQAYRVANSMPATPVYSRPGSSCAQPPTLYSNGPAAASLKPSIMLDTDFSDSSYFPSTPPLSSSGSSAGSPKNFDMLQTPMNPMFSGMDGMQDMECAENTVVDWTSIGSPPMTPVYLQSQPGKAPSLNTTTSDLSTTSCPSLSPSPTPYARSIAASEQDIDFCDPRNLTVTSAPATNQTLGPELTVSFGEDKIEHSQSAAASQPAFDFNPALPHGLPTFEELSDLESEEDFVNSLVNLGDHNTTDVGRPRACTGSSVVSLGHGSCFGDEDLTFDEDAFKFPPLPSPPMSMVSEDSHKDKRQKKAHNKDTRTIAPVMTAAASGDAQTGSDKKGSNAAQESAVVSDNDASSGSEEATIPMPAPPNRRGRKQSLTEDPSKTFVCDLCNRRFRRQEHLKRHYRSLHTQEKPFECNECGKTFSRSDNLAQHARTHAGGAIVMNLLDDGEGAPGYEPAMLAAPGVHDDYSTFGKVLFQMASEIPGSASDTSSDDGSDNGKKKRKRAD